MVVLPREDASAADSEVDAFKGAAVHGSSGQDRVLFTGHSHYLIFCFLFALESEEERRIPNEWTWLSRDKLCKGRPVESAVCGEYECELSELYLFRACVGAGKELRCPPQLSQARLPKCQTLSAVSATAGRSPSLEGHWEQYGCLLCLPERILVTSS